MTTGAPFVLAVPSKGRLQENANAFFARAGLDVVRGRGVRDYRGTLAGMEGVEIAFLSASEIVSQLAAGTAHMGVTGEDLVRETLPDADAKVELLTPLGFGNANVIVAVPQAWIDVRTMIDLEDVASAAACASPPNMSISRGVFSRNRASPITGLWKASAPPKALPLQARPNSSSILRRRARRWPPML